MISPRQKQSYILKNNGQVSLAQKILNINLTHRRQSVQLKDWSAHLQSTKTIQHKGESIGFLIPYQNPRQKKSRHKPSHQRNKHCSQGPTQYSNFEDFPTLEMRRTNLNMTRSCIELEIYENIRQMTGKPDCPELLI